MRRAILLFLLALLTIPLAYSTGPQVQYYVMTMPEPQSCGGASITPPPAYTTFQPTVSEAYLWFYITGMRVGDVVETAYYTPSGAYYSATSGAFPPIDQAGDYCFTDMPFEIAGAPPASMPGQWTVKAMLNGSTLFTLTFTIGGGTASGVRLNINQAIDTNCPNIQLIVSVTDSQGNPISGLTSNNFTLKEGGQSRSITVTPVSSGGSSGALSLAILIDISASMYDQDLANMKTASKQLISQMAASDAIAIYSFSSTVTLVQDFTSDKSALNRAVDSLSLASTTALYDAIKAAAQKIAPRSGRRAIVLMTDGGDSGDGISMSDAIAAAKQAGAPVFPVGFGSPDSTVLTQIANETGGFYSQTASSTDLQRILQSVGQVLSSQYQITYTSGAPSTDNDVQVAVNVSGQTATANRTVGHCSGSTPTCNYFIQPETQSIPANGSTGLVQIITSPTCTWTATKDQGWITIISGTSGVGNGAVSYRVPANPDPNPRTGHIQIQDRVHTITQAPGGVSCTYSIVPTSTTVAAGGGTGAVRLTASDANCSWTATRNNDWINVTSGSSGAGSATINYSVDSNPSSLSRSGSITIAGLTFTVNQNPGGVTPTITPGGIVNAASNRAGTIARGSFFTIYGSNIGPATWTQASYPIPETMGNIVVNVKKGGVTKHAFLHFVSSTQINAILPSDTPTGDVQISVVYNGVESLTATAKVVDTAFGIFSTQGGSGPGIIQNYVSATEMPLNMPSVTAKPGQIVVLWGTGLGPISGPDNIEPPGGDLPVPVEIWIGGKQASKKLYSGRAPNFAAVDNIYFEVPAGVPEGCSVPVQIKAGGSWSNTVRMAIHGSGAHCQDAANPFTNLTNSGGKTGFVGLIRVGISANIDPSIPPDMTLDVGGAIFAETKAGGELAFSPLTNLPPVGACVSTARSLDLSSLLGSDLTSLDPTAGGMLDAGPSIQVTGIKGTMPLQPLDSSKPGPYLGLLGGSIPMEGAPSLPLFLEGTSFTVSGSGGKDVGAFNANINLAPLITLTNASQLNTIDRVAGATVNWSGGDASQTVIIAGGSTDQSTGNSGGFFCLVPATAKSFQIPPSALADVPATGTFSGLSGSIGALLIGAVPLTNPQTFSAPGIDHGYVFAGSLFVRTAQYR